MKGQYLGRYGKNVKNVHGLRGGAIGMKDLYLGGYGMNANGTIGVVKNVYVPASREEKEQDNDVKIWAPWSIQGARQICNVSYKRSVVINRYRDERSCDENDVNVATKFVSKVTKIALLGW